MCNSKQTIKSTCAAAAMQVGFALSWFRCIGFPFCYRPASSIFRSLPAKVRMTEPEMLLLRSKSLSKSSPSIIK